MNTLEIAFLTRICVDVDDSLTWIIELRKPVYSTTACMYSKYYGYIQYNLGAFFSNRKINTKIISCKFAICRRKDELSIDPVIPNLIETYCI